MKQYSGGAHFKRIAIHVSRPFTTTTGKNYILVASELLHQVLSVGEQSDGYQIMGNTLEKSFWE